MSQKRKDKRGRILRNGESQDPITGEYRFSYYENGKKKNFRSWKLNATDPLPEGKRPCLSLREKEEQYQDDKKKGVSFAKGDMTVCELVESMMYENKIALESNIDEGIEFCGDKEDIKQVVSILLDNAIKHTDENNNIIVIPKLLVSVYSTNLSK